MNDTLRTVIIGFLSGLAGATVVIAMGAGDKEPPSAAAATTLAAQSSVADDRQPAAPPGQTPVDEPAAADAASGDEPRTADRPAPEAATEMSREERRAETRRNRSERVAEKLRQAGWSDLEIESLDDARNAAALEMEQLIYDQMRKATEEDREAYRGFFNQNTLRNNLGDEKFEQYLEASGQPTAVTVRNLLRGSAADDAGIRQGDRIRRYGDVRVFDEADLFNALVTGEPGEAVTVEIERDGTIFHVTVPRGPMGTSAVGRRWP